MEDTKIALRWFIEWSHPNILYWVYNTETSKARWISQKEPQAAVDYWLNGGVNRIMWSEDSSLLLSDMIRDAREIPSPIRSARPTRTAEQIVTTVFPDSPTPTPLINCASCGAWASSKHRIGCRSLLP